MFLRVQVEEVVGQVVVSGLFCIPVVQVVLGQLLGSQEAVVVLAGHKAMVEQAAGRVQALPLVAAAGERVAADQEPTAEMEPLGVLS